MRILLVEDETELSEVLGRLLTSGGYVVDRVPTLGEAMEAVRSFAYPLIILDRRLPDGDGLSLLAHCPVDAAPRVLVLSALDQTDDKVAGLAAGADDYLAKPFAPEELLARLKALLRRPDRETEQWLRLGGVAFDTVNRQILVHGAPFEAPRREGLILEALLRRKGHVAPREMLEEAVYGFDELVQSNTLESQISRLRGRLRKANAGVIIHTIWGIGYLLREEAP
ncbi:Transcriptional regulatory protein BasR [Brevundimonas sp. NIBR10]|uniref:response regulator transcription factor n=1 Tax=Brevundimonas sp. NIBR10 TaxID=3015997 RepID=UPI0022F1C9F0|nr:response regulator transcription factor [Brevundimonas sp. NIBR10]WGM45937.1 Transcriptional regulatory protein BasR [Brevundimonas sp. NIBR10]